MAWSGANFVWIFSILLFTSGSGHFKYFVVIQHIHHSFAGNAIWASNAFFEPTAITRAFTGFRLL